MKLKARKMSLASANMMLTFMIEAYRRTRTKACLGIKAIAISLDLL